MRLNFRKIANSAVWVTVAEESGRRWSSSIRQGEASARRELEEHLRQTQRSSRGLSAGPPSGSSCLLCVHCGPSRESAVVSPVTLFWGLVCCNTKHTHSEEKTPVFNTKHTQKKRHLSEESMKLCRLSEGVFVFVLSLACIFNLFDTRLFCENTRGKWPGNRQQKRGSKRTPLGRD